MRPSGRAWLLFLEAAFPRAAARFEPRHGTHPLSEILFSPFHAAPTLNLAPNPPSPFPSYETQEFFLAQVYTPTARENLRFPLQSPRSNVSHEEVPARYDRRDILQPTTKGKIYGKGDRY